jgi:bacteriocin biosynthesis cyclodehydratase domain-containing protein
VRPDIAKEVNRSEDRDPRSAGPGRVRLLQGPVARERGPLANSAGGPRYRLRPSVEAFVDRHGTLCLVRAGGQDLVVRRPDDADVALVGRLQRGWETLDGLAGELSVDRALIQTKLESLLAADLVVVGGTPAAPPLVGEDAERFARQLPYLVELGDEVGLQRQLRDSAVVVIGCGGLGTWAIASLACIGVGHLTLVDHDDVELSNLNRQILYARGDLGMAKVSAAARWAESFDPAIQVDTVARAIASADDVTAVITAADAVVLAADSPPYEIGRWVNAACLKARVPFIVAGQLPPLLKIGPTYVPGRGPCFACHERALARESFAYEDYVAFRRNEPVTAATVGPASSVVGGFIGLELLHLLTGGAPSTTGMALLVDMQTLTVRREHVDRDPECPACKHLD